MYNHFNFNIPYEHAVISLMRFPFYPSQARAHFLTSNFIIQSMTRVCQLYDIQMYHVCLIV